MFQSFVLIMPPILPVFDGYDKEPSSSSYLLQNWRFLSGKSGGANDGGKHGGLYQVNSEEQQDVLVYLKKDPQEDKNICEVFASQLMRFIAEETGENPDIIANVDYVPTQNEGVYIASNVFTGYRDLFLDAHLAYNLPTDKPLRAQVPNWETLPNQRPSYFQHDEAIDVMIQSGRYRDLTVGLALRAIPDDPDLHYENIGAVPIKRSGPENYLPIITNGRYEGFVLWTKVPDNSKDYEPVKIGSQIYYKQQVHQYNAEAQELQPVEGMPNLETLSDKVIEYCVEAQGKLFIIPAKNNTRAAHIDFGGALGDFRLLNRHLDGKIHVNKLLDLIRYRPSRHGPPAYHKKLPVALTEGNEFFHVLARFSTIDTNKLNDKITAEIDRAIDVYKDKPDILISFAKRVGAPVPGDARNNLAALGDSLKTFILENMISKQEHAKTLFLNHFCRLQRSDQVNLLNILQADVSRLPLKRDQILYAFYQNIWQENEELFVALQQIDELMLPSEIWTQKNAQTQEQLLVIGTRLDEFKSVLHSRLCNAYFKDNLKSESKRIGEIVAETAKLMSAFRVQYDKVNDPRLAPEVRLAAIDEFIDSVKKFEKETIKPSGKQQFAIAASVLVGALLGALIGAAVGLVTGALVGTLVGHVAGGLAGASVGSVVGAVKGAGLGTAIAMGVAALFFGSAAAFGGGAAGRTLFFSKTQQAAVDLSQTTQALLFQQKKAILENLKEKEFPEDPIVTPGA
ncbi:hypothetical protein [Legionella genomosp. 1]|uniref:hypothetical protein n=1 Tax=Legionella genomosp. 1 TaxID=1093625 RepID=UPI0013EFA503|nr:hypothetical protein [Legionella genomosp. 1]